MNINTARRTIKSGFGGSCCIYSIGVINLLSSWQSERERGYVCHSVTSNSESRKMISNIFERCEWIYMHSKCDWLRPAILELPNNIFRFMYWIIANNKKSMGENKTGYAHKSNPRIWEYYSVCLRYFRSELQNNAYLRYIIFEKHK